MSRENPSDTRFLEILLHFWPYNRRYAFYYYPYLVSIVVGVLAGGIIVPLYLRMFIDGAIQAQTADSGMIQMLYRLLFMIGIWSLVRVLCIFLSDYCITQSAPKMMRDIHNDCFAAVHRLPLAFFAGTQVGSIVTKIRRFVNGHDQLDLNITRGLLQTTVQLVATVAVVFLFSVPLALFFIAWGIVFFLVTIWLVRWKMLMDVQLVRAESRTTGLLADGITNFLTVKMFARFKREKGYFEKSTDDVAKLTKRSWYRSTTINVVQAFIVAAMSIGMLFLALQLWQDGRISVGTIVLVQTYSFLVGSYFLQLGEQLKAIHRAAADCMEMMEIIQIKPAVLDPVHPEKPKMQKGAIAFQSMSFGYHDKRYVFRNLALEIPSGQRVGLVGYSGAGKSTFVSLLLRFMDVTDGAITIDGQDIRAITQDDLRAHISYVPQEPLLFHRSIRENIAYGKPNADQREIIRAARQAHAHEFIEDMPNGYDTIVGERGIKLSGGERQRIAIARAMLKDAPILVLDEATSSLDSISETLIRDAFDDLVRSRTTLVIAHRLSTVQKLDRIIVLDKGKLVEDGTHEELLKRKGVYTNLWKHQSDGFLGL